MKPLLAVLGLALTLAGCGAGESLSREDGGRDGAVDATARCSYVGYLCDAQPPGKRGCTAYDPSLDAGEVDGGPTYPEGCIYAIGCSEGCTCEDFLGAPPLVWACGL
jgi:hypothetical protein